jgi:hypothetical protein
MATRNRHNAEFNELMELVNSGRLQLIRRGEYHFQVIGRFVVNYYPTKRTIYVNGTTSAAAHKGGWADVIKAATEPPPIIAPHRRERRLPCSFYRDQKQRIWKRDPRCFWCRKEMALDECTLEHEIPLARGGSNVSDNLKIAHAECNKRHGSGENLFDENYRRGAGIQPQAKDQL